jgi:hypothetical protein
MAVESQSTSERFARLRVSLGKASKLARAALYLYLLLIACPIRYWPLESGVDSTWRFALNYAAAAGPAAGSNPVFTMGPFSYLIFPQNIGNNLARGLLFQSVLWLALAAIFAKLFFAAGIPLRNLSLFSFFFALSTPLFFFNSLGQENLMLAGALILLVLSYIRESWASYFGALVLIGLLPFLKLTGFMIGAGALAGYLLERLFRRSRKMIPELAAAIVIPASVIALSLLFTSVPAALDYVRASGEITSGYSAAMSYPGANIELVSALEALAVLACLLWLQAASSGAILFRFFVLLLAFPIFASFKHGFVRQDVHTNNFFCFIALALALVALTVKLDRTSSTRVIPLAIVFFIIWQDTISHGAVRNLHHPSGAKAAQMLWGAFRFDRLKQNLDSSVATFPEDSKIEPDLLKIIGDSPVASLSIDFTNLAAAGINLKLYPVFQRYSAYTPYLDHLNAEWVRDKGPRYLVFDGGSIDGRDPWAETPAMWLEVYRWYDTRVLGPRNLLLERRNTPRFGTLETIGRFAIPFTGELDLPASADPIFWTMKCDYSTRGKLEKLLFRLPSALMSFHRTNGTSRSARVIPAVLVSPVMGNYLPNNLAQFSQVFDPMAVRDYSVDHVRFEKYGTAFYSRTCEVELLRPTR